MESKESEKLRNFINTLNIKDEERMEIMEKWRIHGVECLKDLLLLEQKDLKAMDLNIVQTRKICQQIKEFELKEEKKEEEKIPIENTGREGEIN